MLLHVKTSTLLLLLYLATLKALTQFTFVSKKLFYVLKRLFVWLLRWWTTLKALTLISLLFSQKKEFFTR